MQLIVIFHGKRAATLDAGNDRWLHARTTRLTQHTPHDIRGRDDHWHTTTSSGAETAFTQWPDSSGSVGLVPACDVAT